MDEEKLPVPRPKPASNVELCHEDIATASSGIAEEEATVRRAAWMILTAWIVLVPGSAPGQNTDFDLSAYVQFLESHQNMTKEEILIAHSAGSFKSESPTSWLTAGYREDDAHEMIGRRFPRTAGRWSCPTLWGSSEM